MTEREGIIGKFVEKKGTIAATAVVIGLLLNSGVTVAAGAAVYLLGKSMES